MVCGCGNFAPCTASYRRVRLSVSLHVGSPAAAMCASRPVNHIRAVNLEVLAPQIEAACGGYTGFSLTLMVC